MFSLVKNVSRTAFAGVVKIPVANLYYASPHISFKDMDEKDAKRKMRAEQMSLKDYGDDCMDMGGSDHPHHRHTRIKPKELRMEQNDRKLYRRKATKVHGLIDIIKVQQFYGFDIGNRKMKKSDKKKLKAAEEAEDKEYEWDDEEEEKPMMKNKKKRVQRQPRIIKDEDGDYVLEEIDEDDAFEGRSGYKKPQTPMYV